MSFIYFSFVAVLCKLACIHHYVHVLKDPAVQMRMEMDFSSHVFSPCTFRCPIQNMHL